MSTSDDRVCPIRRTVYFSGRVQGVGFRFTAQAVASRFVVTGFVRNLSDGRVEMVVEGAESEVNRFQGAVEEAMGPNIRNVRATTAGATDEFAGFSIAF